MKSIESITRGANGGWMHVFCKQWHFFGRKRCIIRKPKHIVRGYVEDRTYIGKCYEVRQSVATPVACYGGGGGAGKLSQMGISDVLLLHDVV